METILPGQFEEIVKTYQSDLINFHYRFTNNRFEAEDLAQETFVKAYFKMNTLADPAKLKSWLYQIARNTVIDFFRKNKKRMNDINLDTQVMEYVAETASVDTRQQVLDAEVVREMQRCLDVLGPDDQKMIKMLYYEGFSYAEIADLMGINQNTLKSRLHRARKALADLVQSNEVLKYLAISLK